MATTTTNFGWDIPQSTDLVKDGATAIAALGQDIDTAMVDLKGGTTGQVLAKASGTDLDFSWVAQDDSNAIQNAIVDAKGDLISATAADTPARLAVGTNNHVLTADSTTATGLKWAAVSADSYTTLASGSLSSSALNITSISGSYKKLVLIFRNFVKGSAYDVNIQFNGVTSSNYAFVNQGVQNGSIVNTKSSSSTAIVVNAAGFRASVPMNLTLEIEDYANTVADKVITFADAGYDNSFNAKMATIGSAHFASTSAITSIQTDSTFTSGDYILYGVK
jgi:hypothetical protein